MKTALAVLFICPNQDGFHDDEPEHVSYLLIPGFSLSRKVKEVGDGYRPIWSYRVEKEEDSFIMLDEPEESWQTALIGTFPDCEVVRYPQVCPSCRAKGVKS